MTHQNGQKLKVSIIICTKNRADGLAPCLNSIKHAFQEAKHKNTEIIIVDNASTDNTQEILTHWQEECPLTTFIIYEAQKGISAARNAGIKQATGDIILFTDDDCHLSPSYITEALEYNKKDTGPTIRSGSVYLGDKTDLPITIKIVKEIACWKKPENSEKEANLLGRALIGCNIMINRKALDAIGLFDTNLGAGTQCRAAEDSDYFYRAYLTGVKLESVPDLAVYHYHGRKKIEEKIKLLQNYAIGNGALIIKYLFIYPRFCKHFYWMTKNYFREEFLKGKEKQRPDFSYKQDLLYQIKGILLYIKTRLGM